MNRILIIIVLGLFIMNRCESKFADKMFVNAKIIDADGRQLSGDAIAIKKWKIVQVDAQSELAPLCNNKTEVIDLKGAFLYPGFSDAHLHVESVGKNLLNLNLVGTTSIGKIQQRLKDYSAKNPDLHWIQGSGWDQNDWSATVFPNHADLDACINERPVALDRIDGHALWVNAKALTLAGITKETPDPEASGGKILKDHLGYPTGVLIDNAMNLIWKQIPPDSLEQRTKYILAALEHFASLGLTEVHDAATDEPTISIFKELEQAGRLPIRVYAMAYGGDIINFMKKHEPIIPDINPYFTVRTIKLFSDGALGSRGAYLFEPYSDEPGNYGLLTISEKDLKEIAETAKATGYQVATHAIGDSANRLVLNVYEKILGENIAQYRWRIEHAQVLAPSDIPRFGKLGIIASMQPTHATSDMPWAPARLGAKRVKGAYATKSVWSGGAIVPGGSDAPVESANPLLGFYAAITRQNINGKPTGGWMPEQILDRSSALKMFTELPAYAAFQEKIKGKLKPGFVADFTILDKNLMTVTPKEILQTTVVMTVVGGEVKYKSVE